MRTTLIRGVLALAVLLTFSITPALAQSLVKGRVLDGQGKPVEGATISFEQEGTSAKRDTKTDKKGEFLQVGLASGMWKITASKQGVGTATQSGRVSQGNPIDLTLKLSNAPAGAAGGGGDAKAQAELQALAAAAGAAATAGNWDEAISKYTDLTTKAPTCAECFLQLANAHAAKKDYAAAEASYKQSIAVRETPEAYNGLVKIYNDQKKFDLAAEAGTKATSLSAAAPGGGGNAEATYNQGVVLFNAGKFAEAKTQFEASTKADPTYAPAFYQLGMTALNLGQIPEAVAALEGYLKVAPDGPKAAEVKASLPALQGMLKK